MFQRRQCKRILPATVALVNWEQDFVFARDHICAVVFLHLLRDWSCFFRAFWYQQPVLVLCHGSYSGSGWDGGGKSPWLFLVSCRALEIPTAVSRDTSALLKEEGRDFQQSSGS